MEADVERYNTAQSAGKEEMCKGPEQAEEFHFHYAPSHNWTESFPIAVAGVRCQKVEVFLKKEFAYPLFCRHNLHKSAITGLI